MCTVCRRWPPSELLHVRGVPSRSIPFHRLPADPVAGDNRPVSTIERPLPPLNADERTTLESWLDFHRATLAMKCEGLDDEQAATASAPPCRCSRSSTSLWPSKIGTDLGKATKNTPSPKRETRLQ